jgi:hypothetical protein
MNPRVVASGFTITPTSRVGDYRIMYEVLDDVLLVRVGHRREVYR